MTVLYKLDGYKEVQVLDENVCQENGCIPSSVQWLLDWSEKRGYLSTNINFKGFQMKICDSIPVSSRGFGSVTNFIASNFDELNQDMFKFNEKFERGSKKFERILELTKQQRCVVISQISVLVGKNAFTGELVDNVSLFTENLTKEKLESIKNECEIKSRRYNITYEFSKHITPVVALSNDKLIIFDIADGREKEFSREHIEVLHDDNVFQRIGAGGQDILYLSI